MDNNKIFGRLIFLAFFLFSTICFGFDTSDDWPAVTFRLIDEFGQIMEEYTLNLE